MRSRASVSFLAAVLAASALAQAQQPVVEIQDSLIVSRVIPHSGDTLPEGKFSAAYEVQMVYDTTTIHYTLTEVKHNATRLHLENWTYNAEHLDWDDATMSDSSKTENFLVRTGDTISFYRDFGWWNASNGRFDTTLISNDTLDYAIELVKANGSRAALLDSMGVLRRITRGTPSYRGTGPAMRAVTYVVPSSLDSDDVIVRLRVYTRGPGATYPIRIDNFTVALSDRLTNTGYADYRTAFNGSFAKRRTSELENALRERVGMSGGLQVMAGGTERLVEIRYTLADDARDAEISIYNSAGESVLGPLSGLLYPGGSLHHRLSDQGSYFVALSANGQLLAVSKIVVR